MTLESTFEPTLDALKAQIPRPQHLLSPRDLIQNPARFSVIDVRSEKEFEHDGIPGSANFPILTNEERHEVGYLYKRVSEREGYARAFHYANPKHGRLVQFARSQILEGRDLVVTCWRGGGRSAYALSVLRAAAVSPRPILQLAGGTKAYRREILKDISSPAFYPPLLVLSGNTGSGKSRLIEHLETRGFPVLHLEACAQHMSSAFGNIPYLRAPWHGTQTQKRFEHAIHSSLEEAKRRMALKGFHSVITEAESRKVGGVTLPPVLNHAIRTAPHVSIEGVMNLRVKILREDYFYSSETCLPLLRERLGSIRGRMQGALYARLQEHLDAGAAEPFFRLILEEYYDRIYHRVDHAPLATFRVGTLDELFETGENLLTKILHD